MPIDTACPVALFFLSDHWQKCIAAFLLHVYEQGHSLESLRTSRKILIQFFTDPQMSPECCTIDDVEAFLRRPSIRGTLASATRNQRLSVLSSFYKFASRHFRRSFASPTAGIRYLPRQQAVQNRAFSEEDLQALFAIIPTDTVKGLRDRAIFLLYFWTGKRREEIARLRYGDIEPCTFVEDGRMRSGYRFRYIGKGKAASPQYAELPRLAKTAIDAYLVASGRTIEAGDPLFVAVEGKRHRDPHMPLHSDTIARALKAYIHKAGLDAGRLSIHSLRHASAQQHYLVRPDILYINQFLDHRSLDTTRWYLQGLFGKSDPASLLLEQKFAGLAR